MPGGDDGDPAVLTGTVAGRTAKGLPILATRDGMVALNTAAALPPGTRVTAAFADPATAAAPPPLPPDLLDLAAAGRGWPALRQALGGLDRLLAQSLLTSVVPQPNRKLGAALTFLLSAMRGGDGRRWLGGEAAEALERAGRDDLLREMEREFRGNSRSATEARADEWRPYALPMLDQTGINPIMISVQPIRQDDPETGGHGEEERNCRFLIDVELSRLGPLQLDGRVSGARFDLILRSAAALPLELRRELTRIYADSLSTVGLAGGITFQPGARDWVTLARSGKAGGVGTSA